MWESGLDNSPMYDDVPFDTDRRVILLEDAGLTAMYVADCKALADLAGRIGKQAEQAELLERAALFERALTGLWSEEAGIFLNRRTDTGEWSLRLSPTNFYPLLSGTATQAQAETMMSRNFFNPRILREFILRRSADDPAIRTTITGPADLGADDFWSIWDCASMTCPKPAGNGGKVSRAAAEGVERKRPHSRKLQRGHRRRLRCREQ